MPVAPGRLVASSAEMKMCSSSVAPMPSISSIPVTSFQSDRVDAGNASPAETHLRRLLSRSGTPCRASAIARYDVGAVNMIVARNVSAAAISS